MSRGKPGPRGAVIHRVADKPTVFPISYRTVTEGLQRFFVVNQFFGLGLGIFVTVLRMCLDFEHFG